MAWLQLTSHKETIMEQTESCTPSDERCKEDKHAGQPSFKLIAQDVTADLVIDFWIEVQLQVKQSIEDGTTMMEAIDKIRQQFGVPPWSQFTTLTNPKLKEAAAIGYLMSEWKNRKIPD
jgi:hypothetical protein